MEKVDQAEVIYCPICTFPLEYCEFSERFNECKKWLAVNHPEVYPELEEEFTKIRNGETIPEEEEKKPAEPKKVKFESKKAVTISLLKRGKTKNITKIDGLQLFGLSLKDISKSFRKSFSSGCAVVDDSIEIQGDLIDDIIERLIAEYSIKEEEIIVSDANKTKKSNKGQKK